VLKNYRIWSRPDREYMHTVINSCQNRGKCAKGQQYNDSDVEPDISDDVHVLQRISSGEVQKVSKRKYLNKEMVASDIKETVKNKNKQSTRKSRIGNFTVFTEHQL